MQWRGMSSVLAIPGWPLRRKRLAHDTLAPYFRHGFWGRHRILTALILAILGATYGFLFSVTTTYFLVEMLMPVALVALLVLVLLPDNGVAHERTVLGLLFALMSALAVWPDYLALALPGLPWITALRLIAVPLCLVYAISLSQSPAYRKQLADTLNTVPGVWKFLAAFFVLTLISLAFTDKFALSVNKLLVGLYAWAAMFLIGAQIGRKRGGALALAQLLWVATLMTCMIAMLELRMGHVPWAGHIPSFLKIEDETIAAILSGKQRAALGEQRLQGKFTTPLGLAEFLALTAPFLMHFLFRGRNRLEQVAAAATLVLVLFVIVKTDARLGVVGLIIAVLGYGFYLGVRRWRSNSSSIFAPVFVMSYPVMTIVLFIASFFVGRLRNAVWGSGAYQASTEAREQQFSQGMDLILKQPWGHGIGRAAETLGFTNPDGVLTIDTYYLSIALEMGVLGFIAYYGAFVIAIWHGTKAIPESEQDPDAAWILPTVLALVNFVVIKSILSQQESHPLAFTLLGLAVALVALGRSQVQPRSESQLPAV